MQILGGRAMAEVLGVPATDVGDWVQFLTPVLIQPMAVGGVHACSLVLPLFLCLS